MKQYVVMALQDFEHNGKPRKSGQIFQMSADDHAVWKPFVKIVDRACLPVKKVQKPATKATTKRGAYGTVK